MNTGLPTEQEKQTIRLEYSTPIFEEYGDLLKLTHGDLGEFYDTGDGTYSWPIG